MSRVIHVIPKGPPPLVIAGPSGVGKGTIISFMMKKWPASFGFSVSHTTRKPRPGEQDGIHYFFVEMEDMEKAVERGEFVESAKVHTNMYGTSVKAIESIQTQGKICILDIDIQGVKNVKASAFPCHFIFIDPPSMEELERRLRGRGTETEDKIQVRLQNAAFEMEYGHGKGNFDAIIKNIDSETSAEEIVKLLKKWYPTTSFVTPEDAAKAEQIKANETTKERRRRILIVCVTGVLLSILLILLLFFLLR